MYYIPAYYSNHVNEISYFLRRQLYIKTFMDHSLKMALWKKIRNMSLFLFFNYLLIVFT
jgi:hypothetical protein